MFKKKLIGMTLISFMLFQNILGTLNVSAVTEPFKLANSNGFGGSGWDDLYSVINTQDGGFISVGYFDSTDIGGITNKGGTDSIIIKYDSSGTQKWAKSFGGSGTDCFNSVTSTSDGGFVTVGYSNSIDIDGVNNKGSYDGVIIKYDNNGNQEWFKSFGGNDDDKLYAVTNTSDGGFIVAGGSYSADIEGITNNGSYDGIIVKYDNNGNQEWAKSFGGSSYDELYSVTNISDGGFVVVGGSCSPNIEGIANKGNNDAIIVKYDNNGNQEWFKSFGGNEWDNFNSVTNTQDGGFIAIGDTESTDIEGIANKGNNDAIIVKYDSSGNQEWFKSFGGNVWDNFNSVTNTQDGGFIAIGYSNSTDIEDIINKGGTDSIIVKYDSSGNQEWTKSFGGSSTDCFNSVTKTIDSTIVIVGHTSSTDIKNLTNNGDLDFLIVNYIDTYVKPLITNSSLDLQVVADNSLEMSLSTNQISFTGYNGVADLTNNDLNITVTSGLYYDLFATLNNDLRGSNDTNAIINKNNLGIKTLEDVDYKNFVNIGEPLKLVDNHVNGRNINHNINLKLKGDSSVKADTYSTTITFETIQK